MKKTILLITALSSSVNFAREEDGPEKIEGHRVKT
jgi:hypothetical protein